MTKPLLKYLSDQRKSRENVDPLLKETGERGLEPGWEIWECSPGKEKDLGRTEGT